MERYFQMFIISFLVLAAIPLVSAQGHLIPDTFYGHVFFASSRAPEGTVIDVKMKTNGSWSLINSAQVGSSGNYSLDVKPDPDSSDTIRFYTQGVLVGTSQRKGGKIENLNLSLSPTNTDSKTYSPEDRVIICDGQDEVSTYLEIHLNTAISNFPINISEYQDGVLNNLTIKDGQKNVKIISIKLNSSQVKYSIIRIYYEESELGSISPHNLNIYRYNRTFGNWDQLNTHHNTENNYVWTNISHFSTYGLFGREAYCGDGSCNGNEDCSSCSKDCGKCPPEENGNGGGGSMGGLSVSTCEENWTCSDWSACKGDIQIRQCVDINECGTEENKPVEVRECQEPAKICSEGTQVCTEGKLRECTEGHDWEVVKNCEEGCSEDYSKCEEDIKSTTTTTESGETTTTTGDSETSTGQFLTNTTTGILLLVIIAIVLIIFILLRKGR